MESQNKKGYIYKLICPIDKITVYVGKTINKLEYRLSRHISKTKSKIKNNKRLSRNELWIKNLIELSEEGNISIELIEECNMDLINEREIFWISEYRKEYKLKNLTDGGDGGSGYKHTKETLLKISKNRKGKCSGEEHHNFGKKLGNEHWFKLTKLMKGVDNPNIGNKHKDDTKEKISQANSGEKNGMYGKRMNRTKEQKEKLSQSLKNSQKLKDSRNSKEYKEKISNATSIPILVLNNNREVIFEFKNCRECSEHFNCTNGNIANAIRFNRQIGKGKSDKYWIVRKDTYLFSISKNI